MSRTVRRPELEGHYLEPLLGNRAGQYSIRIKDQYRICFEMAG
jgi:plasmid maintenance system killer protein